MLLRRLWVTVVLLVALVATACATEEGRELVAPVDSDWPSSTKPAATSRPPLELEAVLYSAGAVLQGEIVAIRGPFWNSLDGRAWNLDDAPESYATPWQYREIDLRVHRTFRDDLGLGGGIVTFVGRGSGDPGHGVAAAYGGRFVVGSNVIVALVQSFMLFRDGPVDRLYPLGGPAGVFDVTRDLVLRQARRSAEEALALDDLATLLSSSRAIDRPEWDHFRFPPTAAEQLVVIEARVAALKAEARAVVADPNNPCNFVGDQERAATWLAANPDSSLTVEDLLHPGFIADVCGGFESWEVGE